MVQEAKRFRNVDKSFMFPFHLGRLFPRPAPPVSISSPFFSDHAGSKAPRQHRQVIHVSMPFGSLIPHLPPLPFHPQFVGYNRAGSEALQQHRQVMGEDHDAGARDAGGGAVLCGG